MNLEVAREYFRSSNYICFTTDLDWAPEVAIEETMDMFINNGLKPTVFVTHPSHAIASRKDKLDLGIHPNLIQPSSQGDNQESIINYCEELVPNAEVFRCHRWYASNDLYDYLSQKGYKYESNICTSMDLVDPFVHRSGMVCFPTYLEDGAYIIQNDKLQFDNAKEKMLCNGLKVINIHPMHYMLNTPYFKYTREIKDRLSREEWNNMDKDILDSLSYKEYGIRNFIQELIEFVKANNIRIVSLKEAYERCKNG